MNMFKKLFARFVSAVKNTAICKSIAKYAEYDDNEMRESVVRFIAKVRKVVMAIFRFFFAEETISDIKKVCNFGNKIIKICARIAAIPCFFIGLSMILSGLTSSLWTVILGLVVMALPKAILEGNKRTRVIRKEIEEKYDNTKPAFASIGDSDSEK